MLLQHLKSFYAEYDTTNFSVLDFVAAFGSPLEAAAYSKLFWPDFVELEGMVFRDCVIEDELDKERVGHALQQCGGDLGEVERSFNLTEIPSGVFGKRSGETSEAVDLQLANTLGEMWRARLAIVFPDREFIVDVGADPNDEPTVTFQQLHG